jgi:GTP-binding protein
MKLKEVKFVKSVDINSKEVFFDEKHEIIFLGRSNVGKSSLMNAIFEKKDLVKTSSMPGKTRTANLFLLNNKYYFTDLP